MVEKLHVFSLARSNKYRFSTLRMKAFDFKLCKHMKHYVKLPVFHISK